MRLSHNQGQHVNTKMHKIQSACKVTKEKPLCSYYEINFITSHLSSVEEP